jgi:hypothetical protein
MEAICSSETSADFQRTTRCYIPEDSTLHNHRCENLKSYLQSTFIITTWCRDSVGELIVAQLVKKSHFMEPENPLPCSQILTTGSDFDPVQSNPNPCTLFLKDSFYCYSPGYTYSMSPKWSTLQTLQTMRCMNCSSLPWILPISSYLLAFVTLNEEYKYCSRTLCNFRCSQYYLLISNNEGASFTYNIQDKNVNFG